MRHFTKGKQVIAVAAAVFFTLTQPLGVLAAPDAPPDGNGGGGQSSSSNITWSGATTYTSATETTGEIYSSTTADQNALLINTGSGAAVTLTNPTVTKSGGTSASDNYSFYGINSAVMAKGGGTTTITGGTVTTTAAGANGVFSYGSNNGTTNATGDGTTVNISDTTIKTTGDGSGGIMTTYGGTTNASNLTITTDGGSSAPIRTDRGGGWVTVNGGTYTSNGLGSPAIYSTADVDVSNATLVSNLSEGVCIEGTGSIELNDCDLTANNTEKNGNAQFLNTIMIYQSMSGDASNGTSAFSMTGGKLTSKSGNVFHVTNTSAIITLENVAITDEDGKNSLFLISNDGWSKSGGSNTATVNAKNQILAGNIVVSNAAVNSSSANTSTLTLNLTDGSTLTGAINTSESDRGTVDVTLASGTTWTLTGDSYVSSISGEGKLNYGSHTLYVGSTAYTASSPYFGVGNTTDGSSDENADDQTKDDESTRDETSDETTSESGTIDVSNLTVGTKDWGSVEADGTAKKISITKSGDYTLTGSASNVYLVVGDELTVSLTLNGLTVNNAALTSAAAKDQPTLYLGSKTAVAMKLTGASKLTGDKTTNASEKIISQKGKGSTLAISGTGSLAIDYAADDAINVKKGDITFDSGTLRITNCYGDGIQVGGTMTVNDGKVSITTVYANSSTGYYTSGSSYVSGKNTITESEQTHTKTEYVTVDTGSHKGIKAGTKAKEVYYGYDIIKDSGGTYSSEESAATASGGLVINGGEVWIDTTASGLKANNITTSGYTRTNSGVYIIGSPDDALHSNNTLSITGGKVVVKAADDGLTASGALSITGDAVVKVKTAYEGLEGQTVTIGTESGTAQPTVQIFSNDDGINAASKSVTYYYESEDNEDTNYKKISVSSTTNNNTYIYDGSVRIKIDSENEKSVTLSGSTVTYKAEGDGIDSNGSCYIYGGTTTIFGESSGSNSPIDENDVFYLDATKATVLAAGQDGMNESTPSSKNGTYVTYGSTRNNGFGGFGGSGGGMPGGDPRNQGQQGSSGSRFDANSVFTVKNGNTTVYQATLPYAGSFVLYASPELSSDVGYETAVTSGGTYTDDETEDSTEGAVDDTSIPTTKVTLEKEILSLTVGGASATITANQEVTWTTTNAKVVKITGSTAKIATVKPVSAGTAYIQALAADGSSYDYCKVTVTKAASTTVKATGISLNTTYANLSLDKNSMLTLTATLTPSTATNQKVTWKTSNKKIATVTAGSSSTLTATVTALKKGTATITAKAADGPSVKCVVYVTEQSVTVTSGAEEEYLAVGASKTLNSGLTNPKWKSTASAIVSVSKKGVIKAKKAGQVTIFATGTEGIKTYSFFVQKPVLSGATLRTKDGFSITDYLSGTTSNVKPISYSSSNENVLTVYEDGEVKFFGNGKAKLTVTYANGAKVTAKFTVKTPSIKQSTASVKVNKTKSLTTVNKSSTVSIVYLSSDPSIVTVTSGGKLKGLKAGTATITMYVNGTAYDTCTVTVK